MAKVLFRVEQNNQRLRNFALSPLSIDVVLHMLADGLQRNALEQMLNFLGSENMDEILSECRDMMTVLEDLILHKGGNNLCMVNGVWIDEGCSLPTEREPKDMDMDEPRESNYIEEVLRRIFHCYVKSNVDFLGKVIVFLLSLKLDLIT